MLCMEQDKGGFISLTNPLGLRGDPGEKVETFLL
jgi:hypothetical protein